MKNYEIIKLQFFLKVTFMKMLLKLFKYIGGMVSDVRPDGVQCLLVDWNKYRLE